MNRIKGFDLLKGICILLIVTCHHADLMSILPKWFIQIQGAIYLNAFFVLSGFMLYRKSEYFLKADIENRFALVKHKFFSLLYPYFSFSVITVVFHAILTFLFRNQYIAEHFQGYRLILRDIVSLFSGMGIGTLWFLPVLFISYIVSYYYVVQYLSKDKKYVILLFGFSFFLIVAPYFFELVINGLNQQNPMIHKFVTMVYRSTNGIAYSLLGLFIGRIWRVLERVDVEKIILIFISIIIVGNFVYVQLPFHILTVTCFSILCFRYKSGSRQNYINKICDFFCYCGKNSLLIMFYHYNIVLPIEKEFFIDICGLKGHWLGIICFCSTLLLTLTLVKILENQSWHKFICGQNLKYKND